MFKNQQNLQQITSNNSLDEFDIYSNNKQKLQNTSDSRLVLYFLYITLQHQTTKKTSLTPRSVPVVTKRLKQIQTPPSSSFFTKFIHLVIKFSPSLVWFSECGNGRVHRNTGEGVLARDVSTLADKKPVFIYSDFKVSITHFSNTSDAAICAKSCR